MMSAPSPRKRFQIHLSTAIVLMFVAGGLLWGNLHRQRVPQNPEVDKDVNDFSKRAYATVVSKTSRLDIVWKERYSVTSVGWPCRAAIINDFAHVVAQNDDLTVAERTWHLRIWGLAIDIVVAFAILSLAYLSFEWLIRRRASRKT